MNLMSYFSVKGSSGGDSLALSGVGVPPEFRAAPGGHYSTTWGYGRWFCVLAVTRPLSPETPRTVPVNVVPSVLN